MFDSKTGAERFPHYLNNRHANIKLTMVVVKIHEFPFLNVLVKCNKKTTLSQQRSTERKLLRVSSQNGTPLHPGSIKLI